MDVWLEVQATQGLSRPAWARMRAEGMRQRSIPGNVAFLSCSARTFSQLRTVILADMPKPLGLLHVNRWHVLTLRIPVLLTLLTLNARARIL
ncbi:MAG: hypothetical protein KGZ41_06850 [Dethiobacter sp.]|nr:hypothetical protein [Dethiobacter sp.]